MTARGWIIYGLGAACRLAFCLGISLAIAAETTAGEPSAKDLVAEIYAKYQGADPKGVLVDYGFEASLRAYFEPSLATLIRDDRISARIDAGRLDFDPFVDARDADLNGLDISIGIADRGADQALAIVTFARGTEKVKQVRLELAKHGREWRISNIHWGERDLRTLLTGR